MRKFLSFWSKCIGIAACGSAAFANDWQWIFGIPVVLGLLSFHAAKQGATPLSTGYPIWDGVLTALGAFVVTWLIVFIVRTFKAAPELYYREKARADALEVARFKQQDLDDIAGLRERLAVLRIDMERPNAIEQTPDAWGAICGALQTEIAEKIERFASLAARRSYQTRGNIFLRVGGTAHQLHIDTCIHDLDYLRNFIDDYSRMTGKIDVSR